MDAKIGDQYKDLIIKNIIKKPRTDKKIGTWIYYTVECKICGKIFDLKKYDRKKTKSCQSCCNRKIMNKYAYKMNKKYIGKKFGNLTIIGLLPGNKKGMRCETICECGHKSKKLLQDVVKGIITYCGKRSDCKCYIEKTIDKFGFDEIIGKQYGCYTIETYLGRSKYLCRCKCGREVIFNRSRIFRYPPPTHCRKCKSEKERSFTIQKKHKILGKTRTFDGKTKGYKLQCGNCGRKFVLSIYDYARTSKLTCGKCCFKYKKEQAYLPLKEMYEGKKTDKYTIVSIGINGCRLKCNKCGLIKTTSVNNFKAKIRKSGLTSYECKNKCRKKRQKEKDIMREGYIGKVVNNRKIIAYSHEKAGTHFFKLQCLDCGKEAVYSQSRLSKSRCRCALKKDRFLISERSIKNILSTSITKG